MEEEKNKNSKIHPLIITNFNSVMLNITVDIIVLYWLWSSHKEFITSHTWINGFIYGCIIVEFIMGIIICLGYMIAVCSKQVYILEKTEQKNNKNNKENKQ